MDTMMLRESADSSRIVHNALRVAIVCGLVATLVMGASAPVAASSHSSSSPSFCDIRFVGDIINTGFTIFMGGALVMGLLTWVATSFTESLPLPQDTKKQIKRQRNSGIASALRAVFVPALLLTFLDATVINLPSCVSVIPF
jgi:hypothetical protein